MRATLAMTRVGARAVALVAVGALGLGGCGKKGNVPLNGNGTSAPTKAAFTAQADAICAAGETQLQAVPRPQLTGGNAQIMQALAAYVDRVLPIDRAVVARLKRLPPPDKDQDLLGRYLAALEQGVNRLQAVSRAAHSGNPQAVQASAGALNNTQAATLARQFGFRRCGGTGAAGG